MSILPQFDSLKTNIENISLNLYIIQSNLDMIDLLNNIPNDIQSLLLSPEFIETISKASETIKSLKDLFNIINPKLKKEIYKQKHISEGEPYAGFKIDDKPLIGYKDSSNNISSDKPIQLSFDELNTKHIEETGKPIKPINHKSELPYKGDCPCCGAPNDYIYDNNKRGQFLCKACNNKGGEWKPCTKENPGFMVFKLDENDVENSEFGESITKLPWE